MGLGGVRGAGLAMSEITQYFLLLFSPYLSVQSRLRVTSPEASMMPNTFSMTSFVYFLLFLLNFTGKMECMQAHGKKYTHLFIYLFISKQQHKRRW